jgi:chromate transporter
MVAYIRRLSVERRGWLSPEEFEEGVALCQMIPGATAMQTAAYVGLRARGVAGAAASFVGFGLPAFVLMVVLSALYDRTHALPATLALFQGLRAVVVALVAEAVVSFGRRSIRHWSQAVLAALAALGYGLGANPILLLLIAAPVGLVILPPLHGPKETGMFGEALPATWRAAGLIGAGGAAALALLWAFDRASARLAALMLRIDLFAFGGGFASVPLMYHEIVDVRHWLPASQLADGIALGQVTPGPIVITAAFVGHQLHGLAGAVAATVGIFLPSFLLVLLVAPLFSRFRRSAWATRLNAAMLCSFVGLLVAVGLRLGQSVTWSWPLVLLAAGGFVALRLRVDVLWVVAGGAIGAWLLPH